MEGCETLGARNSMLAHEFSVQLTEIEVEQRQHNWHIRALHSSHVNRRFLNGGDSSAYSNRLSSSPTTAVRES